MIQTTLFYYFGCNNTNEQPKYNKSSSSFKQANLNHYFKTVPKKKNLILNYFKPKVKKKEEKIFGLVLVDIKETKNKQDIKCIKKNMYDKELKYIAISYRWGEEDEQYVETPDYIAHITSFYLGSLINLCFLIEDEPDLKEIPYLWIDTISMDQRNKENKKENILKMNQIYENATYILAVPDLHVEYLKNNSANEEVIGLIYKYNEIIHENIQLSTIYPNNNNINNNNNEFETTTLSSLEDKQKYYRQYYYLLNDEMTAKENEDIIMEIIEDELKIAYRYLAFIIDDWSNRTWVISEYLIAKNKYEQYGTPLKYVFLSLLNNNGILKHKPFFSYYFFIDEYNHNTIIDYKKINDSNQFIQFLKSRFIQRSYVNMIVGSYASKDEDRYNAILPSWIKYRHLIKNKNTVSEWEINNMIAVKLKLYEILDDDDLWDKARLLRTCSNYNNKPILPSFATCHLPYFIISEIDNINHAQKMALDSLLKYEEINEYINSHQEKEDGSIFKQNLLDIQFHQQQKQFYLKIKVKQYFIFNHPLSSIIDQEELTDYSLEGKLDDLDLIYIPFFTYHIPEMNHPFPLDQNSVPLLSGILLMGNMNKNRWIQVELYKCHTYGMPSLCYSNGYVFKIY